MLASADLQVARRLKQFLDLVVVHRLLLGGVHAVTRDAAGLDNGLRLHRGSLHGPFRGRDVLALGVCLLFLEKLFLRARWGELGLPERVLGQLLKVMVDLVHTLLFHHGLPRCRVLNGARLHLLLS